MAESGANTYKTKTDNTADTTSNDVAVVVDASGFYPPNYDTRCR